MGSSTNVADARVKMEIGPRIQVVAFNVLRYGLILAIAWIAAMKGTEYEVKGIQPLIANSPFLSWGYGIWTVHHFTEIIGAVELTIVLLISLRHWSQKHVRLAAQARY